MVNDGDTISRLLLRHGMAVRRCHTERARSVGLDDRGALATAHVVVARELTPWQLGRRLSLGTAEVFELVVELERAGYLRRGPGGRRGFLVRPTPLALATFGPPSSRGCDDVDPSTGALLGRFIASAADAVEREADRLLAESLAVVEPGGG